MLCDWTSTPDYCDYAFSLGSNNSRSLKNRFLSLSLLFPQPTIEHITVIFLLLVYKNSQPKLRDIMATPTANGLFFKVSFTKPA